MRIDVGLRQREIDSTADDLLPVRAEHQAATVQCPGAGLSALAFGCKTENKISSLALLNRAASSRRKTGGARFHAQFHLSSGRRVKRHIWKFPPRLASAATRPSLQREH